MIKNIKYKNKHRIVVIGGSGFIGSRFVEKCLLRGYTNIGVADLKRQKEKHINYQICDLANKKTILKLIKKNDIVCHFACSTIPKSSEDDILHDLRQNLFGTIQLLEVCAAKKIQKIIFLSSGGTVYGNIPKSFQVSENAELNPICAHGVMKICCEKYVKYFANKFNFKYIILRLANPYGRNFNKKRLQGVIDLILYNAMVNKPVKIWGSLNKTRDYIHIDDLCELLITAINKQIKSSCYNVGSGNSQSIISIIKRIEKICKKKIKINIVPKRSIDLKYNQLDISKTKKKFNWQPLISINQGIQRIFNQYLENTNNHNKS